MAAQHRVAASSEQQDGRLFLARAGGNVYVTPYVAARFAGILPGMLPAGSHVNRIAVVTDLDIVLWDHAQAGPPAKAFRALVGGDNPDPRTWDWELDGFFERTLAQEELRGSQIRYFRSLGAGRYDVALMVLPAIQTAAYHLGQMAGSACFTWNEIPPQSVHDAMLRHEWAHLNAAQDGWPAEKEIFCDAAALNGANTALKAAWMDARLIGAFTWPFPGAMIGPALIDRRYATRTYLDEALGVQAWFRENLLDTFYDPARMARLYAGLRTDIANGNHALPPGLCAVFAQWAGDFISSARMPETPQAFRRWFGCEDDPVAWRYLTQAYACHVQVSAARDMRFCAWLYEAANAMAGTPVAAWMGAELRGALSRRAPDAAGKWEPGWKPQILDVDLPFGSRRQKPLGVVRGPALDIRP